MAQLVLTAASSAVSAIGSAGIGSTIARTAAGVAASFVAGQIDSLIFGPQRRRVEGPRLESFTVQASTEGAGVLRIYGRARVAGQLIWAANFKETTSETTETAGGKGTRPASQTTFTEYLYSISLAIGLCEGEIDRIGRVWADGKPLNLSDLNYRIYRGSEDQMPDDLIASIEGNAPAFRGLAYIVFEDLPLRDFGNRIPQLAFEVEKRLAQDDENALENALTAVTMIPGSGEFVYGTTKVSREESEGVTISENVNNNSGQTNFTNSLDALLAVAPNMQSVSLVVSWFGTDLNAGQCTIRPGVETPEKTTTPYEWFAGGVDRAGAHSISLLDGAPAYGGTPTDRGVIESIQSMNAADLKVMFHPFILMDVPGSYPWRGRINVGADDGSLSAGQQISQFFGSASPSDFSTQNGTVIYTGPNEWSFRRMILHYAHLCSLAGGVDAFIISSELRGITTARSASDTYPAIAELKSLAADVRSILGPSTKISYGADWSEYFGHQPTDGSGDVYFHLDDFWSDANVDFIGIDNYVPLADWRDGFAHLDAIAGYQGPHDIEYLKSNVEGGERYDWFYASEEDREAQTRSPITDGLHGEDWIYRVKDFKNWWQNPHHNRPGGVRNAAPTNWLPRSKPIVFTEAGCPAVDKGANQPNVFVDPKSTESAVPHFSTGARDDLAQRRHLEALHAYWRTPENNPVSPIYNGPMIDADRTHVYAWDARPFPFFPARQDIWGDAPNWEKGHWLNGRAGRAPLDLLINALAGEAGDVNVETGGLDGVVTGYIVDRPLSPREMIDPLADVFQFDVVEVGDLIRFQSRDAEPALTIDTSTLVENDEAAFTVSLAQESDLPAAFRLGFIDEGADYSPAVAEARDPGAFPSRETGVEIAAVIPHAEAEARARSILADAWVMRETATFALPPSQLTLEPGDAIATTFNDVDRRYRVIEVNDTSARTIEAVRVSPSVYEAPIGSLATKPPAITPVFGPPIWALMDLPITSDDNDGGGPLFAAFADPWPGAVSLFRASQNGAPSLSGAATVPAMLGTLEEELPPSGSGRWSHFDFRMRLTTGVPVSRSEEEIFDGANLVAVQSNNGQFEVLQFLNAELQTDGTWQLSQLLRGQAGSEIEAAAGAPVGARVVMVNRLVAPINFSSDLRGIEFSWSAGPDGEIPGSENFTSKLLTLSLRSLQPLSPVHLRDQANSEGHQLSWIRRTRIGGDSWEGEIPLGEMQERYQVTIYDQGDIKRVVETDMPSLLYSNAEIAADFTIPPAEISFGVRQWSDRVGWGREGVRL